MTITLVQLMGMQVPVCAAKDIYEVLQPGADFDRWIKSQIKSHNFASGKDYMASVTGVREGSRVVTHFLTAPAAILIIMSSDTELGRGMRAKLTGNLDINATINSIKKEGI